MLLNLIVRGPHLEIYYCRILFILGLSLFQSMTSANEEPIEFTFAYDVQEGFPSFMGNGQSIPEKRPGTYIEILQLVEQKVPIKLKLVRLPWARCKAALKANLVDGINSSFSNAREEIGIFPYKKDGSVDTNRKITSSIYRLYTKGDSPIQYDPVSGLILNTGKGILAPLGYSIVDDFKKRGILIEQPPTGVKGIMQMLALGRASGVIAHENQATHVLKSNSKLYSGIRPLDPPIKEKNYYILISKDFYQRNPAISEQIWNVIGELRKSRFPDILNSYLSNHRN